MDIRSDKAGPGTSAVMVRGGPGNGRLWGGGGPVWAWLEWAASGGNAGEDEGDGESMWPIFNRAGAMARSPGHGGSMAAAAVAPRFTPGGAGQCPGVAVIPS